MMKQSSPTFIPIVVNQYNKLFLLEYVSIVVCRVKNRPDEHVLNI